MYTSASISISSISFLLIIVELIVSRTGSTPCCILSSLLSFLSGLTKVFFFFHFAIQEPEPTTDILPRTTFSSTVPREEMSRLSKSTKSGEKHSFSPVKKARRNVVKHFAISSSGNVIDQISFMILSCLFHEMQRTLAYIKEIQLL